MPAIIKKFIATFVAVATASLLLASAAQAECNFFTGWVDNKDGTVRDPRNGLIWKRCAEGAEFVNGVCTGKSVEATWDVAMHMAKQSRYLEQSDWRLPSKEEYAAIMGGYETCSNNDRKKGEYAVSKAIAHRAISQSHAWFWTSSLVAGNSDLAWRVHLSEGYVFDTVRDGSFYVRLIRTSQVLGGDVALEFVEEGEKIHQRIVRQHQLEQEQERKKLAAFKKSLREGDDTNCGPVIEVKGKLVKVAFAVANYGNGHWIKREQVLSPDYGCRFVNGQYQPEQ